MLEKVELPVALAAVIGLLLLCGCSSSTSRVYPPSYSSSAGSDALASFDADGDGLLDQAELEKVPGLKACAQQVDSDGDGKISAAEIDERVNSWIKSKVGEMPLTCQVELDGEPVTDAVIEFIPEEFLGDRVPSGKGTTNEYGETAISMPDERLADPRYGGMACGIYRVYIRKDGIPDKFNKETTLGCEVGMKADWVSDTKFTLKLSSQ